MMGKKTQKNKMEKENVFERAASPVANISLINCIRERPPAAQVVDQLFSRHAVALVCADGTAAIPVPKMPILAGVPVAVPKHMGIHSRIEAKSARYSKLMNLADRATKKRRK
jgi:hypothetical protein